MENSKTQQRRSNSATCKICNSNLDDGICPKCGYFEIAFPEVAPKAITDFEERRQNVATQIFKIIEEIEEQNKKIEELTDERSKERKKAQETERVKEENEQLRKNLDNSKAETNNVKQNLVETQKELEVLKAANSKVAKPIGIIHLSNVASGDNQTLFFYEGRNTFGSNPSKGLHQKLRIETFSASIAPIHFEINTLEHSYAVFKNLTSTSMIRGITQQPIPKEGVKVNNSLGQIRLQNEIDIEVQIIK